MLGVFMCLAIASTTLLFCDHKEEKPKHKPPTTAPQPPHDAGTYDQGDRRSADRDPNQEHGDVTGNVSQEPWQGARD